MAVTRDHPPSRQTSPFAELLRARTRQGVRRREIIVLAIFVGLPALALVGTVAIRQIAIRHEPSPEAASRTGVASEPVVRQQPSTARARPPARNQSGIDDRAQAGLSDRTADDAVGADDAPEPFRPLRTPEATPTHSAETLAPLPGNGSVREVPAARAEENSSDMPRRGPGHAPNDRPTVVVPGDDLDQPAPESAQARDPLRYQLLLPGPNGRSAPLILMLHGTGGVRAVWRQWAAAAQSRGYIVCLPVSSGTGAGDPKSGNRRSDNAQRWAAVDVPKLVDLARQLAKTQGADPSRSYIFGYSNGAFYAQQTALQHPEVFAAVVSVGGGCNLYSFPPAARQVGVYMIHGTADQAVPLEIARQTRQRLLDAGFAEVILKEYPGRGHELFEAEIDAVFDWLPRFRKQSNED